MNITCPPDSYDVNIEPAKDDVMFDDIELVMSIIEKLLTSFMPRHAQNQMSRHRRCLFKQIKTYL